MMNTIKKCPFYILLVGLLIVGVTGVANFALARGGHGPGAGMHLKMLWDLDLSTEQKTAIGQLLPAYREEREGLKEKMRAARERMHTLMTADALDEEGIRGAARDMAPIMEEMAVVRAHFMFDLKGILSPEQVQQLQERREGGMARRHKQHRFRQDMMDAWLQMPAGDATSTD